MSATLHDMFGFENEAALKEYAKPYEYTYSDSIDGPDVLIKNGEQLEWQRDDMEYMYNHLIFKGYAANWSEMGCKKTSTGLWLIQRLADEYWETDTPNVFICTTRGGKGTFFKLAPHILPDWQIFNVTPQGIFLFRDGEEIKIPKLEKIPEKFEMKALILTHFNLFSKTTRGRMLEVKVTDPETGEEKEIPLTVPGTNEIKMMPWSAADYFVNREWELCWIDESHRIKDKDTKWTVVVKRSKDMLRMDSTGTGFINRPHEIHSLLDHMTKAKSVAPNNPDRIIVEQGFWEFRDRYCAIEDYDGVEVITGIKPEMKEEFRRLVRSFGPRRTLSEVMPHIKEPIFSPQSVELSAVQRKMYDELKTYLQTLDQKGVPINSPNVLALLQRCRAICAATPEVVSDEYDPVLDRRVQKIKLVEPSSKLDAVMDIIEGLEWDEDRKDPVVVFSNFVGTLTLLEARFNKSNNEAVRLGFEPDFPYLWMKQSHSDQERFNMWNDLFPSLQYRVFMSTLQTGGESISLTAARHVIFIDRSWSPKDNSQGIGRIRRPGQEGQPVVIHINAKNTIDQYIHDVNNLKQGWFNEIFGNEG